MGLGKTVQTVALVAALAQYKGCTGPHLVLAPKAVLPNWVRTCLKPLQSRGPSCNVTWADWVHIYGVASLTCS